MVNFVIVALIFFLILVFIVFVFIKLFNREAIYGNGNSIHIKRLTENYVAIGLSGPFNVELVDGIEGSLTLKGEENLLQHVTTKVKKGKLYLDTEKRYNLKPSTEANRIEVTVPIKQINSLTISGSGDIVSKKTLQTQDLVTKIFGSGNITSDIEVETLSAVTNGSGYLNFSGKTKRFEASTRGSGKVRAYALEADAVGLNVSGSGTLMVKVKKKLKAIVSGSGSIHYQGNPEKIDIETSGSGKVFKE